MCETTSKSRTIKTQARRHGGRSGVFIVKSEQISHTVLVLKRYTLVLKRTYLQVTQFLSSYQW